MTMNPKIIEILEKLGACGAALDWLHELPETTTLQEASIVWTKDPLWTATWDLVLDKTIQGPSWKQELKCWAEDIRDLFSRPEVREKKSKV